MKSIVVSNINELVYTIKQVLSQCEGVQIYISSMLVNRILNKRQKNIIWEEEVANRFLYCDTIEKAYIFSLKDNNKDMIVQIHLVKDVLDYMHLTFFATQGIIYRSNLSKINNVIIIESD